MAENHSSLSWGNHQWLQRRPRRFELESGRSVLQRRCTRCGRDFVLDLSPGACHAIQVSIFSFYRLRDEVTRRWLSEPCPGERLAADEDDRQKHSAELRISWERMREGSPIPKEISAPSYSLRCQSLHR